MNRWNALGGGVVCVSTIALAPSLITMVPTWEAVVGLGVAAVTRLVAACVNSAPGKLVRSNCLVFPHRQA